jgi:hypothetical protein
MDLPGLITGLAPEAAHVPWEGPEVRIIEHQAHAPGHAALLIQERGILVAGDMLSDILMPFLDLEAANPTWNGHTAALAAQGGLTGPDHYQSGTPKHCGPTGGPREGTRRRSCTRGAGASGVLQGAS